MVILLKYHRHFLTDLYPLGPSSGSLTCFQDSHSRSAATATASRLANKRSFIVFFDKE